jgi:type IV secretion system protein VirB5
MPSLNLRLALICFAASIAATPAARAQWAVIDVPAIVQLVQEVQTMQQQLATARNQLQSAQQALQAMTGDRGMESLLGGIARNYLPSNWTQVANALQGQGIHGYAGLSADVQSAIAAMAVLSPQRLSTLSPTDQRQIQSSRQWSAMQQALAHQALANSSDRFASIQGLITAISTAGDQKAILDLQARISAELGMLQNEQTKIQVLFQAARAEEMALKQQARERVIEEHGRFETRFQPVP